MLLARTPCKDCGEPSFGRSIDRCKSCERKDFWRRRWQKRTYLLPEELSIDDQATFDLLGYWASNVGPGDHKKVVFTCTNTNCGKKVSRVRRNIKPHPLCHPCSKVQMWATRKKSLLDARADTIMKNGFAGTESVCDTASASAADKFFTFLESLGLGLQLEVPVRMFKRTGRQITDNVTTRWQFLDATVPAKMIAFEYNGLRYHHEHSKTPRGQWYHYDKMRAAEAQGYQVINVFEDEWLLRRAQVESVIRAKLGLVSVTIGARACCVASIDTDRARTFINAHHVQELNNRPKVAWGLFQDDRLLGVLSLTHDKKGDRDTVILNRLCFAGGVRVVGGAGKLLQFAITWARENGYKKILSASDNRWSSGGVYKALGFQMTRDGTPDYAYVVINKPRKRVQKENLKKSKTGCPKDVLEVVWNFDTLGMARIWDCGHRTWECVL